MELLRDSIPMVSLAVLVAAVCARAASSWLRPGLPRLASLLPVVAFLAVAPLAFSSPIIRGLAGFFLGWLGVFKLVLLAVGRGPLDPALPVLPFVFTTALPVKLRCGGTGAAGAAAACRAKSVSLVSSAVKVAVIAAILHAYQYVDQLHLYIRLALYGVHMYCFLDFLLPCIAAAGAALGMEMEPQCDRPFLASSLRDFWGRRWNLMVSAILRPSVYDPVRARAGGKAPVVLATFLVSGLMHEVMIYYLTLRSSTGQMTAFFLLHGVCCVAEEARSRARGGGRSGGGGRRRDPWLRCSWWCSWPAQHSGSSSRRSAGMERRRCCWRNGQRWGPSSTTPAESCSGLFSTSNQRRHCSCCAS